MSEDELLRLAADKCSLTESARTALEHEIQVRAIESNPLPIEQTKLAPNTSRWARLGIFLCVALASGIIAAVVFVKGDPTSVGDLTEELGSASLKLGLAAWAVSEVVAGRWLTLKRTWIAAIALYSVAFVLAAIFLGKPAVTKLAELNEEQTQSAARVTQEKRIGEEVKDAQTQVAPRYEQPERRSVDKYPAELVGPHGVIPVHPDLTVSATFLPKTTSLIPACH